MNQTVIFTFISFCLFHLFSIQPSYAMRTIKIVGCEILRVEPADVTFPNICNGPQSAEDFGNGPGPSSENSSSTASNKQRGADGASGPQFPEMDPHHFQYDAAHGGPGLKTPGPRMDPGTRQFVYFANQISASLKLLPKNTQIHLNEMDSIIERMQKGSDFKRSAREINEQVREISSLTTRCRNGLNSIPAGQLREEFQDGINKLSAAIADAEGRSDAKVAEAEKTLKERIQEHNESLKIWNANIARSKDYYKQYIDELSAVLPKEQIEGLVKKQAEAIRDIGILERTIKCHPGATKEDLDWFNDQIRQQKEKFREAGEKIDTLREKKLTADNVQYASERRSNIAARNGITQSNLNSPNPLLDPAAIDFIKDQLDYSEKLAETALDLASNAGTSSHVKLLADLANDISTAAGNFVSGFGSGLYTSFQTVTDAAAAIWKDPTLIGHLYGNTMNYLTSTQSLQDLKHAWKNFVIAVKTGDSYAIGKYTGKLAGDAVLILTGIKVMNPAALEAIEGSSLGEKLAKGIRATPSLSSELTTYDVAMQAWVDSGFDAVDFDLAVQHRDNLITVRDSYNLEVSTKIPAEKARLLGIGETKENIAKALYDIRRNDIGLTHKNMTHPQAQPVIYKRNIKKYGDALGPTFDDLVKSAKKNGLTGDAIYDKIIQQSESPNKSLNKVIECLQK